MNPPTPTIIWPKSEADPPEVEFLDGFAAGAELSRQSAYQAWLRYSALRPWFRNDGIEAIRKHEESQGFDNGLRLGRDYAGKPAEPKPMTAEQHSKYPKGRFMT